MENQISMHGHCKLHGYYKFTELRKGCKASLGFTVRREVTLCHASESLLPGTASYHPVLPSITGCDDLHESPESPAISSYLQDTYNDTSTRYRYALFELRPLMPFTLLL
eukprot:800345-Amorphochlora_amoeboformis.AAC.1